MLETRVEIEGNLHLAAGDVQSNRRCVVILEVVQAATRNRADLVTERTCIKSHYGVFDLMMLLTGRRAGERLRAPNYALDSKLVQRCIVWALLHRPMLNTHVIPIDDHSRL